jgi:catechol 2,3-dioxygenase-like lactoylglutathione lyase family enzyme
MANTAKDIGTSDTAIKGIHHIGISVGDLARSSEFFEDAANLTRVSEGSFSGTGVASSEPSAATIMKGPNAYLELMQFDSQTPESVPVEGPGFTHVCFQSPSELRMYNSFKDAGARAVSWGEGPVDLGGYGVHYAYLRDADKTMYEVEQVDRPPFEGQVWIAHVALVSHDIDRLVEFYSNVFGIEPYRRVNKATGPRIEEVTGLKDARMRAAWFNVTNMVLEIWQFVNPVTPDTSAERPFEKVGYNKFAFEVSDLASEITRLKTKDVKFVSEPLATPIGLEAYATDPDGNRFSLVQLNDNQLSIDHLKNITWKTA